MGQEFICRAVETKLHRYIVDVRICKMMILLTPTDSVQPEDALRLAEFINAHVSEITWVQMPEETPTPLPYALKSS
jgi:hypothetical protein